MSSSLFHAAPIKLPVTLSCATTDRFGSLAFTHAGQRWTATGWAWRDGVVRYFLTEFADGTGERREVTEDELAAMLNG